MMATVTALRLLPDDRHNRELLGYVRPPGWTNPQPAGRYNLVVIGAGTAGLVSAVGAAGLGARVAIVERHLLGGDCLNYGCVPSKALIRAARAAADARNGQAFGVRGASGSTVDFPLVMERMRALRASIAPNDSAARLAGLGIDVFIGQARFVSREAVEVDGRDAAVLARGGGHRCARRGTRRFRVCPRRLSHQRDRVLADDPAASSRGHRRRTNRV